MELKRVVVTGLGAITPVGNNVPEFWENLVNGVSGAGPITHFDASQFKTQFACEVKGFDATQYIDRKEARKMDLYTQYAVAVAKEAVADSGLDIENEDLNRIGVIFGAGIGGIRTFEEETSNYALHKENGPKYNPFFIPKMISDIAAGQISIMYGFHGPNYATCSACATSTNAIADAFNLIRLGKANVIVSGGSEAAIAAAGVGGFNAMHALSTRNDEPQSASRPFSASRDGFVMGEGGGLCIFHGTKDTLICGCYGVNPWLLSGRKPNVPQTLRRVKDAMKGGHEQDWIRACKESAGSRVQTKSNFLEAGPFNEMVVMGVLAVRLQRLNKELLWDGPNMRFTNIDPNETIKIIKKDTFEVIDGDPKFKTEWTDPINAQEFAAGLIKHNYREGWKLVDMPR